MSSMYEDISCSIIIIIDHIVIIQIKSSLLSYWYKVKYKIKSDSHAAICLVHKSIWHNTKYKDKITNLAQIAVIQYRDIWTQEIIRL